MPAPSLAVIADATCTRCGCMCDDIDLVVDTGRIVEARRACKLGAGWFERSHAEELPACLIEGQPNSVEDGIARAAGILANARYPLLYGFSGTSCETQRIAVGIADRIGGSIDTPTSIEQGPTGVSFQGVGEVTSSLGEVANRGDLIIYWGTDPETTHPRHLSRYSLEPKGMFVPRGREDRTCVVVDVRRTPTADKADVFIQVPANRDFEALWTLRALAAGQTLDEQSVKSATGVPWATWQDLAERMKRAKFGAIFFGTGLSMSRGGHVNSEALLGLVRDLNAYTRFVARPMRGAGNVFGADNVLAWQTGFPFGVNLSRGYPRFNPGEYTAEEILARGEADAALVVAGGNLDLLSAKAKAQLARIPTVVLDWQDTPLWRQATVALATAAYGIHTPGTAYRMDDVPLPLRPALDSPHASDGELLARIERQLPGH